tara:strand:- start:964 stop:2151 length:1188 start_codon:yes stop_codon:yes gene_type:complete
MKEFVILMAVITAMVALSIDMMLPALGVMANDLSVIRRNDIQFVLGIIFIGLSLGMIAYGPISDTTGRRKALFTGISIFLVGSFICWVAQDLTTMLIGRFLQGFGAAGPRVMTIAIVRDRFNGREMAQVMSFIMSIFIIIPALAPALGQVILNAHSWHAIFAFYIAYGGITFVWAYFRLDESLPQEKRNPLKPKVIIAGFKEAAFSRFTLGYTVCSGLIFSLMLSYINSAQQIFHELFKVGDHFAFYFGLLASTMGVAFAINSIIVKIFGMRIITFTVLTGAVLSSTVFLSSNLLFGDHFLTFLICTGIIFFCMGMTFGNVSTMALEPMGHIAGLASAFMGAVSTLLSILIGGVIGQLYDGTLLPLATGYFLTSSAALALMVWIEKCQIHPHSEA